MARHRIADAPPLTQERLRELLRYDPETGHFWRLKSFHGRSDPNKPAGEHNNIGYIQVTVDHVRYHAHRLAWFYVYGVWPVAQIDHINGIRHDNRIVNLREATNTENCRHAGMQKNNKSGFTGVFWDRSRWVAQIKVNGKILRFGRFKTPEEAHAAYCEAAQRLHGQFRSPGDRPSYNRKIDQGY